MPVSRSLAALPILLLPALQLVRPLDLDCDGRLTFVIARGYSRVGDVLGTRAVRSLDECLLSCGSTLHCEAVNFVSDDASRFPECQLLAETTSQPADDDFSTLARTPEAVYFAQRLCLPIRKTRRICDKAASDECSRNWYFEVFARTAVSSGEFVAKTLTEPTLVGCLTACLQRDGCRAALHNRKARLCRLATVAPHSVLRFNDHFRVDSDWNLFENNCASQHVSTDKCKYLSVKNAGITDVFDERRPGVLSVADCEGACKEWPASTCRSFTYDRSLKVCYLSHTTSRISQRRPLNLDDTNLQLAEIDDCFDFSLQCQRESMVIRAKSATLFSGRLQSRNDKSARCVTTIQSAYEFETRLKYNECGTKREAVSAPTYTNLLFLKDSSTALVTVRDKLLQVMCRIYDSEDLQVSYRIQVNGNNTLQSNEPIVVSSDKKIRPQYNLEIFNEDQQRAQVVSVGDIGYLSVGADPDSAHKGLNFRVSDVVATDVDGNTIIELYDHNGCPIDSQIVSPLQRTADDRVQGRIRFFGFEDASRIVYRGLVQPCLGNCSVASVRRAKSSGSQWALQLCDATNERQRRHARGGGERTVVLSESQFAVSTRAVRYRANGTATVRDVTSRVVRLPELLKQLPPADLADSRDELPASFVRRSAVKGPVAACLTSNAACLVVVLLICTQAVLLSCCVALCAVYAKRVVQNSLARRRLPVDAFDNPVQYVYAHKA